MDYQEKRKLYRPLVVGVRALLLGGLVSAAVATDGLAQGSLAPSTEVQSSAEPSVRPSLRALIDTIPARRTAPAASAAPSESRPAAVSQPAAESAEDAVKLTLRLSERRVYVYRGDALSASYPVAVGKSGWETPTGEFEVFHQLVDPGWTNPTTGEAMPPGPDNPLGDRWIAFWTDGTNSIGFHGTPNRDSVGQAASHGCIRMYNEDVRQLYEIVSVGTPVTVVQ